MPAPSSSIVSPNATAAHTFAAALARHGVDLLFGQSIPSRLHLAAPGFGIRQVGYRTENAGAAMADGFARISHRAGVVTAQNGPAATLLVPGLAEALKASIPVVAIVQDLHRGRTDKNAFQDLDQRALFQGVTKQILRIPLAERIEDYVDLAFTTAMSGRPGPVVLLCPYDVLDEAAPAASGRAAALTRYPLDRPVADPAQVRRAATLLAGAERPLVIAGGGIHLSDAADDLARLQEEASLPVATTSMGKGAVDERHPLSLGPVGYYMGEGGRARHLRALVEDADVILLIGNRTNQNGTDSWQLYPTAARYIHLDIDPVEVGRNYEVEVRLVGDARATLQALRQAIAGLDLGRRRTARAGLEARIAQGLERHRQDAAPRTGSDARPIRPERLMAEMDRVLTPESIVVADASYAGFGAWSSGRLGFGRCLDILGGAHAEDVMSSKPSSRPEGPRYIVKNWSAYDRALRRRGDVTVWISEEAVAAWLKSDKRTAGGDPVYADLAIETVLMVRTVFHLPLRQAEGFVAAVFDLMGISLPVPDHTTLSRRGPGLHVRLPAVPATGPVEILVDSTGLRVVEIKSDRKGRNPRTAAKRREWRKLHLGMGTGSGRLVASELTPWRRADAAVLPEVVEQVDGRIDRFLADRAFDGQPTYDLLIGRRQELPIPRWSCHHGALIACAPGSSTPSGNGTATSPMFRPTAKGRGKQLPATRGAA